MRQLLTLAAFLALSVDATPALAQFAEGGGAPEPPRLDEKMIVHAKTWSPRGQAIVGVTCQVLEVEPGESFLLSSAKPGHRITIEAVGGAICYFGDRPNYHPQTPQRAVSPEPGKLARLVVSEPGWYSVRVYASDVPDLTAIGLLTTARTP